jgi:exodeoxyribonuclease V gamma subunit
MLRGWQAMFLYRSNRSERLADKLAEVLRQPPANPLAPELIVVQSRGMERWLAMELSQRLGVFANAQFPFPRHLLERISHLVLGEPPEAASAFGERALMWAVAALLPERLSEPAFAPIARYLEQDADGRLRIQLAQRIARVLDDYTVYRPELLLAWERGEERGWEASLWRALVSRHGRGHQAARAERLIEALRGGERLEHAGLPQRLCVFGISSLPPLYLSMLSALGERVETHLFVLGPSREYFADIRAHRQQRDDAEPAAEGHPLLASLGRLGREFQDVLEERTQCVESDEELYVEPGQDSLLHTLQSDILGLRNRGAKGGDVPRLALAPNDTSVLVQICHGPMREVEVLHDQLVALLEDPQLEPHEIVVMTPDIEAYAPVIEAVFGQRSGRPRLPYSIADKKTRTSCESVAALYALLETVQGRMTASGLLDLLTHDCIRRKLAIAHDELDTLRGWVEQSGIRWGVDAAHRAEVEQPALEDNTWRFGLDRMLLGYAMQGRGRRLYAGILPFDEIEGGAGELLGKLAELCERVFRHKELLAAPRPLRAWHDALLALLEELVDASPATTHEHQLIRATLTSLVACAEASNFADPLDLRTVQTQLEHLLDERLPSRGLLDRGITFCQLVPMRSIPFKVVCLIGMDDDAFPGKSALLGFDRMAEKGKRRLGDRSRRDDDRYMFLEALLSARERVLISYVGRGIHDNRKLPPSVVVGELLDAIAQGFTVEPVALPEPERRAALEQRLCVAHRMHAFSPRYFERGGDPRLFSFAKHYCDGARALGQTRGNPPLLRHALALPAELPALTIEELVAWVTVPIRTFLRQQLGLYLGQEIAPLLDREPIELNKLDGWKLGNELLGLALEGAPVRELLPVVRGRGVLPLGTVGALVYDGMVPKVEGLARAAQRHRSGRKLDPLSVELELDGTRLTGTLRELWPDAHLHASYSKIGRRFELEHFIRHVVLNCALAARPAPGYPRRSIVVARTEHEEIAEVHFEPLAEPEPLLRSLLGFARAGQRDALPFVYEPARAYGAVLFDKGGDPERALRAAASVFNGDYGAHADPYIKLFYPDFADLLREGGPLGFRGLADTVLKPFFEQRKVA